MDLVSGVTLSVVSVSGSEIPHYPYNLEHRQAEGGSNGCRDGAHARHAHCQRPVGVVEAAFIEGPRQITR